MFYFPCDRSFIAAVEAPTEAIDSRDTLR